MAASTYIRLKKQNNQAGQEQQRLENEVISSRNEQEMGTKTAEKATEIEEMERVSLD